MIRTKASQESSTIPIVIASSFTSEPVQCILSTWMGVLHLYGDIEFAPYNQIFQQLLDPMSLMHKNQGGINILLLRFEDWLRAENDFDADKLSRLYNELCSAIHSAVLALKSPLIVCICPNSPRTNQLSAQRILFNDLQKNIEQEFKSLANCHFITAADWDNYPMADYYDATRDELGHIPYTPTGYAALGTVLARKIYSVKCAPYKVIVLDCDNTLWDGVIGEDGLHGIDVSADWQYLQTFMIAQKQAGMLLCLCSKNIESDVLDVLDEHTDMRLRREDIVSWRINWLPKSENIRSLAAELNLGLDAFIFVDDNPMECEEVRVNCPDVLSLNLPKQHIPDFLKHIWVFDRIKVTSEDKMRTSLYQQDIARKNLEKNFSNYQDFLDGLELEVNIAEPRQEQIARVAQLTQRTNQFNNTTIRRTEIDIQRLAEANLQVRMVEVKDRYGDYGLVGVLIFGIESHVLCIQSFMLSCRVLGRGVENHILKYMANIAQQNHLPILRIPYIPTAKNIPILHFLENIATEKAALIEGSLVFDISTESAEQMNTIVRTDFSVGSSKPLTDKPKNTEFINSKTQIDSNLAQTTINLHTAEKILAWVENLTAKRNRDNTKYLEAPKTEIEKQLVTIWQSLLNIDSVSTNDDYFELGGSSLLAVELIVEIERTFSVILPLTSILEYPTIQMLATRIQNDVGQNIRMQPILLNKSSASRIIYFIHDGDGEVLLYRNLALHLAADFQVYGIKPRGQANFPMLDTCIVDMAAYYVGQIYEIQAQGPYLLGGMCAGGVIAFEVTRQIQAAGHKVDFVGLIDAADVLASKRLGRVANARLTRISAVLDNKQNSLPVRVLNICTVISKKIANLIRYETSSKINKWKASLKIYLLGEYQRREWNLPMFLSEIEVRNVYLYAEANYKPETGVDNELVLLRATEGNDADEPYVKIYADPLLGWGKRTTVGVKVYDISGGHSSMLQEPNVKHMADCIREYVRK